MTAQALALMKEACLTHLEQVVAALAGRVTLSSRVAGEPERADASCWRACEARAPELAARAARAQPRGALPAAVQAARPTASARRARASAAATTSPQELARATCAPPSSRCATSARGFVAADALRDVIRQVEVFGFHFAPLDVREHADVHRHALDEILGDARRPGGLRRAARGRSASPCSCARSPIAGR